MIEVANLKIFWTNGSYETPLNPPPADKFTRVDNPNAYLFTPYTGEVTLCGFYNYAKYKDSYYFLEITRTLDVETNKHIYLMIRDEALELRKLENYRISGELVCTTEKKTLIDNIEKTKPLGINPADLIINNLDKKIIENIHWEYEGKENPRKLKFYYDGFIPPNTRKKPSFLLGNNKLFAISSYEWNNFMGGVSAFKQPKVTGVSGQTSSFSLSRIDNWKLWIVDQVDKMLHDIQENPENYEMVQIDNKTFKLQGKFQIKRKEDPGLGTYTKEIDWLDYFVLGTVNDVIHIDPTTLYIQGNRKPGPIPGAEPLKKKGEKIKAKWQDDSEAITVTQDEVYTFTLNNNFKFDITLDIPGLGKDTRKNLTFGKYNPVTEDDLKNKPDWDKIGEKIREYTQIYTNPFKFWEDNREPPKFYESWASQYTQEFKERRKEDSLYLRDIPKKYSGGYDFNEIAKLYNGGLYKLSFYSSFFEGYDYAIRWGGKYVFTKLQWERDELYNLIKANNPNKTGLPDYNTSQDREIFFKYWYSKNDYSIDHNGLIYVPDDITKETGLFFLSNTNYYVFLNNGKVSLIPYHPYPEYKKQLGTVYEVDIPKAIKDEHAQKYGKEYEKLTEDEKQRYDAGHLIYFINSKINIVAYNKKYEITNRKGIIKNFQIWKFPDTEQLQPFEYFWVIYKDNENQIIHDVINVERTQAYKTLSAFNAVELKNLYINNARNIEDLNFKREERELERQREDYKRAYDYENLNIDYTRQIINTAFNAASTLASITIGRGLMGKMIGSRVHYGISGLSNAGNDYLNFQNLSNKYDLYNKDTAQINAERFLQNHRLNTDIHRLREDKKNDILKASHSINSTTINNREMNKLFYEKILEVEEVHIQVLTPTKYQFELIGEYYGRYGIECQIPKFDFIGKDHPTKTAIWRFRHIDDIDIRDPVLRTWAMGKFLNGLKFVNNTWD